MMILSLFLAGGLSAAPPVQVRVHADQPTARVSPAMYGVFFEEINQAGEGGLYAELLRTRGMEDGSGDRLPTGWKAFGDLGAGSVRLDATTVPFAARPHSLKIERASLGARVGVVNEGFWGIPVRAGGRYRLTLWVRGGVPLEVALEAADARRLASTTFAAVGDGWRRVEATLRPGRSDAKARLVIAPSKPGTAWLGFASLMPLETWKGRKNGLRTDLAGRIASLRPGFVRFPGGCFVEGHTLAQAFDWKRTLGPVEGRPPMPRIFWGYPSSNGLGYHEYLQWCEDLGARALFVANCGMSHTEVAPMEKMDRYVGDALDAIEYANGPSTSKWGALRAKNGHPKPFNLRYLQIGNENGGPAYDERYALMARAIKARYPEVELIANVWGGVPKSTPLEIIDEHYYSNPAFFWRNAGRYDGYDRQGPKVYVGEYAVTRGSGNGNLAAALAEAAFMTGMERNADVVRMTSYPPLFVNENNRQWNPTAVVFDSSRSYGTPSYWVQWLFANHRPDRILRHQVKAPAPPVLPLTGRVGLQTWHTQAEFRNVELEVDGRPLLRSAELSAAKVQALRGDWRVADGLLRQTSLDEDRRALFEGVEIPPAEKVVLRLQARKLGGREGFIVMMGVGPGGELQWNLGGWDNTVHAFQIDGQRTGRGVPGRIESGRWYDIRIEREGATTRAYLDGKPVEQIEDVPTPDFAAVAGIDERANEIIVKAVNGAATARRTELVLDSVRLGGSARGLVLRGNHLLDENSFDAPDRIHPRPFRLGHVAPRMTLTLEPYSVTVIRIPRR